MVGVLENIKDKMTLDFKEEGDILYLLGNSYPDINSSEYLHKIQKVEYSPAPHFDIDEEYRLQQVLAGLIGKKLVRSAHDVSEGGLFVTLAESAFPRGLGFDVVASDFKIRKDAYWFGEAQSRVVVSVSPSRVEEFTKALDGLPAVELGVVTGGSIEVDGMDWGRIEEWKESYDTSIGNVMARQVELE
jgi:phosphoribosylformylglycinamidine synthase subunit PurL